MTHEDRPFAWLAALFREGYRSYVRFMGGIYGGAAAAERTRETTRGDDVVGGERDVHPTPRGG